MKTKVVVFWICLILGGSIFLVSSFVHWASEEPSNWIDIGVFIGWIVMMVGTLIGILEKGKPD